MKFEAIKAYAERKNIAIEHALSQKEPDLDYNYVPEQRKCITDDYDGAEGVFVL